ncbi:MAG: hypothetical protein K9J37_23620 [Saprospiraceae bacterium]|nr:hypothetical protein [Saprospiraceae bacterium]MCF8252916.1 hypothetical protein [Saprospiraceae bacterium]MCF8313782.1 hypothetical protein [Saprospiraceae bacterium]MCF8442488.1 hypothetical protein [Saprospiraceae bacterium]
MKFSQFLFFLVLLAAAMFSCKQSNELLDADILSSDAEFAIPLLKARTSIQDLLENFDDSTYIEIDAEGIIHLRYEGDVLTQSADEFFEVVKTYLPPLIPLDSTTTLLDFNSSQDQLNVDFARYASGSISVGVVSNYVGMIDMTVSIPEASKNGQVLSVHQQFMSPTGSLSGSIPVINFLPALTECVGYELQPVNGMVHVQYTAVTDVGDTLASLPLVALVNKNINFSYIEGYLGNFTNKGKRDSVSINFFKNWIQGDVFFDNPVITMHIDNSFGMPTRSSIDTFDIITADELRIPLQSSFINDTGIDFVYPTVPEAGQSKSMIFTFDADNSNIEDVLGSRPIGLDYKVDAISNPDSLTNLRGFITDSSFYKIKIEVDLPLHGRASGFGVVDSFDLDFSSYDELKEVEFKMVADNEMPLAIDVQGYFVGENGEVLDSLFNGVGHPIEGAPVDANGIVTQKITTTTFVTFDATRFDKVRSAKRLDLHAYFSTSNNGQQSVKAFADQFLEIRMGMKVKR